MTANESQSHSVLTLLRKSGIEFDSEQAATDFCNTYMERLLELVHRNLSEKFSRRIAPEDVVQSALRTWVRRAQLDKFDVENADDFWKLLCTVALNKLRKSVARHSAQKRDVNRVLGSEEVVAAAAAPSDSHALEFAELVQLINEQLSEQGRQILDMKLAGYTDKEIAVELNISTRTISRQKNLIEEIMQQYSDHPSA